MLLYIIKILQTLSRVGVNNKRISKQRQSIAVNERPLIVSECCWSSLDDKMRAEYIRVTLSIFKKYDLGFVAHALI